MRDLPDGCVGLYSACNGAIICRADPGGTPDLVAMPTPAHDALLAAAKRVGG